MAIFNSYVKLPEGSEWLVRTIREAYFWPSPGDEEIEPPKYHPLPRLLDRNG